MNSTVVTKRYEEATPLHQERLMAVVDGLLISGVGSVVDFGCGSGELLERLIPHQQFHRLCGVEPCMKALTMAAQNLGLDQGWQDDRLSLKHESLIETYEDFSSFEAATLVEVIEHIEPRYLSALEKTVFAKMAPSLVILTTPNREYNIIHGVPATRFRHPDHFFEWNRAQFQRWASGVGLRHGYNVVFEDIGEYLPEYGSSTQMATFSVAKPGAR